VEFKWWGLQSRVEKFIHKVRYVTDHLRSGVVFDFGAIYMSVCLSVM